VAIRASLGWLLAGLAGWRFPLNGAAGHRQRSFSIRSLITLRDTK